MVSLPDKNEESLNRAQQQRVASDKAKDLVYEDLKKDHPTADEALLWSEKNSTSSATVNRLKLLLTADWSGSNLIGPTRFY